MRPLAKQLGASTGLYFAMALAVILSTSAPASAITVELAKKCREMSLKAHPPTLPGTKAGSGQAERDFFRACISNNGDAPRDDTQKTAVPNIKQPQ